MSEYIVNLTPKLYTDLRFRRCEEIVRCRDCKFKDEPWNCAAPYYVEPNGFCAWGERKVNYEI